MRFGKNVRWKTTVNAKAPTKEILSTNGIACGTIIKSLQVYDENFNYIHTIEADCENLALSLKYIFVSHSNIIDVFCSKTFKK